MSDWTNRSDWLDGSCFLSNHDSQCDANQLHDLLCHFPEENIQRGQQENAWKNILYRIGIGRARLCDTEGTTSIWGPSQVFMGFFFLGARFRFQRS